MKPRNISRREALRAGALGTVGLAAGSSALVLPLSAQGDGAQATATASHHDMVTVGQLADRALRCRADEAELAAVRDDVMNLCSKFTPYP